MANGIREERCKDHWSLVLLCLGSCPCAMGSALGQGWSTRAVPCCLTSPLFACDLSMNFWPVYLTRLGCCGRLQREGDSAVSESSGAEQFSAQPGNSLLVCVGEGPAWTQLVSLAWPCWLVSPQAGGSCGCSVTPCAETHWWIFSFLVIATWFEPA